MLDVGDPRRILYGLDGYGNTCGAINNWNDTSGPDLTAKTKVGMERAIEKVCEHSLIRLHHPPRISMNGLIW